MDGRLKHLLDRVTEAREAEHTHWHKLYGGGTSADEPIQADSADEAASAEWVAHHEELRQARIEAEDAALAYASQRPA